MAQNVCCVDQPGDAGRDVEVTDVCLGSPYRAELLSASFFAEGLREGG